MLNWQARLLPRFLWSRAGPLLGRGRTFSQRCDPAAALGSTQPRGTEGVVKGIGGILDHDLLKLALMLRYPRRKPSWDSSSMGQNDRNVLMSRLSWLFNGGFKVSSGIV